VGSPIILALDTDEIDIARNWIAATHESVSTFKVGLEFFLKHGADGIAALREAGDFELFLDLKLHDIPNTVGAATRSVGFLSPKFLTVHASGGAQMISAAVSAAPSTSITAVTVLTSLGDDELSEIGFRSSALSTAVALAALAISAGARSIVCSPLEVGAIRNIVDPQIQLITPGVRPLGSDSGDQKRTTTPSEAITAGADFVVIGRPITSLWQESAVAMSNQAKIILDSIVAKS
jgi:orotidine-5'-phosphate decarboxylase